MIKTLYKFLGWVPILGSILKAAYIGSLVKQVTGIAENWKPNPEVAGASGDALDKLLSKEANTLVTEFAEPLELGMIGSIVIKQGVKAAVPVMRKAAIGAATPPDGASPKKSKSKSVDGEDDEEGNEEQSSAEEGGAEAPSEDGSTADDGGGDDE